MGASIQLEGSTPHPDSLVGYPCVGDAVMIQSFLCYHIGGNLQGGRTPHWPPTHNSVESAAVTFRRSAHTGLRPLLWQQLCCRAGCQPDAQPCPPQGRPHGG